MLLTIYSLIFTMAHNNIENMQYFFHASSMRLKSYSRMFVIPLLLQNLYSEKLIKKVVFTWKQKTICALETLILICTLPATE